MIPSVLLKLPYCLYNGLEEWSKNRKQEGWLGDRCRSSGEEEGSFEIF